MEQIGLKAPGNHSASCWINNLSILLLENLQTSIFMISGFGGLVGTLIYGLKYTKLLQKTLQNTGAFSKIIVFVNLESLDSIF